MGNHFMLCSDDLAWIACHVSDKNAACCPVRRCGGVCIGEALFLFAFLGAVASWLEYDMRPVYGEVNAGAVFSQTCVPRPGSAGLSLCIIDAPHESHAE